MVGCGFTPGRNTAPSVSSQVVWKSSYGTCDTLESVTTPLPDVHCATYPKLAMAHVEPIRPRTRRWMLCWLAVTLFIDSIGCVFLLPGRSWRLTGSSNAKILLVSDTPQVRHLISEEDAREEEVRRFFREPHTRQYPPGRTEFLRSMAQMPGVYVPGRSYCNIVERSKSKCGSPPVETATYVLVQVTTGPSHGERGWVCGNAAQGQFP